MYASTFHLYKYIPQGNTHNDQCLPIQIPSHTQRPNCGCQQISLTQNKQTGGWGVGVVTIFHYTHNNQMRGERGGLNSLPIFHYTHNTHNIQMGMGRVGWGWGGGGSNSFTTHTVDCWCHNKCFYQLPLLSDTSTTSQYKLSNTGV